MRKFHHHHHVHEGLGSFPCSLTLKMKLVTPSLPRSSYVLSSFWFNLTVEIMATSQFRIVYRILFSVNTETEDGHRVKRGGMGRTDCKSDLVQ